MSERLERIFEIMLFKMTFIGASIAFLWGLTMATTAFNRLYLALLFSCLTAIILFYGTIALFGTGYIIKQELIEPLLQTSKPNSH
ncbi:MAG: hypothetical protein WC788_06975 [Candidatus Paceibacterota bacterium]|jgi:hypothetical protein